jgi:hypothetical protein
MLGEEYEGYIDEHQDQDGYDPSEALEIWNSLFWEMTDSSTTRDGFLLLLSDGERSALDLYLSADELATCKTARDIELSWVKGIDFDLMRRAGQIAGESGSTDKLQKVLIFQELKSVAHEAEGAEEAEASMHSAYCWGDLFSKALDTVDREISDDLSNVTAEQFLSVLSSDEMDDLESYLSPIQIAECQTAYDIRRTWQAQVQSECDLERSISKMPEDVQPMIHRLQENPELLAAVNEGAIKRDLTGDELGAFLAAQGFLSNTGDGFDRVTSSRFKIAAKFIDSRG